MTKEQMKLIENIKTIHEGITLFMVSSGVLDIMYNKVVTGSDPLILLDIDKKHLETRKLLTGDNALQRLTDLAIDPNNASEVIEIMYDIVKSNKRMTDLLNRVGK